MLSQLSQDIKAVSSHFTRKCSSPLFLKKKQNLCVCMTNFGLKIQNIEQRGSYQNSHNLY